jgi:hypothetical protein
MFWFGGTDLRYEGRIFTYDIDELLRVEDNYKPSILRIPEFVDGTINQVQPSTAGRYLGAVTTLDIPAKSRTRETSFVLWDFANLKHDPEIRKVTRQTKNRKGIFAAGLWCVEKRDDDIEIEYIDIPV